MKRIFYHGGKAGLKVGGYILPAKEIGYNEMERAFQIMYGRDYTIDDAIAEGIYDPNYVYLTTDLAYATTRAAVKRGRVYEVEPVGEIESDVDFLAYRCSRALIVSALARSPIRHNQATESQRHRTQLEGGRYHSAAVTSGQR